MKEQRIIAQNIAQQRLYNQQIAQPRLRTPAEVIAWLGAIQGQDYPGAKWSIAMRLPGSTEAEIEQAVAGRQIFRTWVMRGTLHLVAAADVRWMVALFGQRQIAQSQRRYRELELEEPTLKRSNDILVKALQGGRQLTRKQLLPILEQSGISNEGQRGIHMLQRASLEGLLVQGVVKGNNDATFMLMDEALPDAPTLPRDVALAELARRYFTSRGPATLQDFAWWTGLPMADVRAGFEAIKDALIEDVIDGISYWFAPGAPPEPAESPTAYTPPGFDEYLLGYKDRSTVLDPQYATRVCPGGNGIFFPTMVVDGRMVGTWKRAFKKGQIIVTTAPFEPLPDPAMEAFVAAIQRFGEYHQMPVVVE